MGILAGNGKIESGQINYTYTDENGERKTEDLTKLSQKQIRYRFCGKHIAMVFQDPMTSLDPTMTIGDQIMEGMILHKHLSKKEASVKAKELLEKVGITDPEKRFSQYPHQLSGGMRQRVVIAIALSCDPDILICDEPTTALDVTIQAKILAISALDVSIQAQVVNLMKDLQEELGTTYLFIAHDLSMVKYISDRIGVMHLGHIVETGTTDEIFSHPIHPYTKSLLSAIPHPDPHLEKHRTALQYDKDAEGVDYTKGIIHQVTETHSVLATDEEYRKWTKESD